MQATRPPGPPGPTQHMEGPHPPRPEFNHRSPGPPGPLNGFQAGGPPARPGNQGQFGPPQMAQPMPGKPLQGNPMHGMPLGSQHPRGPPMAPAAQNDAHNGAARFPLGPPAVNGGSAHPPPHRPGFPQQSVGNPPSLSGLPGMNLGPDVPASSMPPSSSPRMSQGAPPQVATGALPHSMSSFPPTRLGPSRPAMPTSQMPGPASSMVPPVSGMPPGALGPSTVPGFGQGRPSGPDPRMAPSAQGMPPSSAPPGMPPMSAPGMPPPPMPASGMPPSMPRMSHSSAPGMLSMPPHGMPPTPMGGMGHPPPSPRLPAPGAQMSMVGGGGLGLAPPMSPGMGPPPPQMMPPQQQPPPGAGMPPPPRPGYPGAQPGGGGMFPSQQVRAPPSAPRRSLDPDQMPSPITVMEDDQKNTSNNGGHFDTNEKGQVPPLVTTDFVVRDYGNASPRYIRSSMYYVPESEELRKQSGVPFGLVISPLARTNKDEIEPPITDFGPSGPVRCVRCKAYMCSLMHFIDGGRKFVCAFCKAATEVPAEYFQHLDHTGKRMDHYQRPELCLGTYECLATKDYCRDSREPKAPGIIFAIDVSYPMVKEGVVELLCSNMKELVRHLPRDRGGGGSGSSKTRVGFMTYDSKINFYNINGSLSQPQQMTVGDVEEMFVPLAEGLFCTPEESEAVIDSLMEQIPNMFSGTRETETVLGPVIQAGKEAFEAADCSGKLIIFHHNLPVAEAPGKLRNRDDRKVLGGEKEKTVLMPQTKDYNGFGQECVKAGCSVDIFLFNNAYVDVATVGQVCRITGGQLYKYTYFHKDADAERLLEDIKTNLSRPVVFDAIMRVRTSTGVRPVEFYGSFFMANTTDAELASINSESSIACEVKYDDKLTEEDGVYIQVALLFTSCEGQRRLRIINLALNCGNSMAEMYRNCELDAIVNFTAKQSIARMMETNPKAVKEHLVTNCAQILACYRKNCASPSSDGQLILPECMKLLPLYTNCLLKSDAISGGPDVGCDERAFLMGAVSSMDVRSSVVFFYPRFIPLHEAGDGDAAADGDAIIIPDPVRSSIDKVQDDGAYLLENGVHMFIYVGLAVDPGWVQAVFGVPTAAQINVESTVLEERDNPASRRVRAVVRRVREQRPRQFMRLAVVRQRDKLDVLVRHYLCEDKSAPGSSGSASDTNFSYVDFLMHMHKEIRALL